MMAGGHQNMEEKLKIVISMYVLFANVCFFLSVISMHEWIWSYEMYWTKT